MVLVLVERRESLTRLDELWAAAHSGAGATAFVAGEAGAGKSALVAEFASTLGSDSTTWTGHCDPLATSRPLSPLRDLASTMPPRWTLTHERLGGHDMLDRLHEDLAGIPSERPVLIVFEDVHWADAATLDVLRFIGRRIPDWACLLVCTYRDDEVVVDHPLRPVLGDLGRLDSTHRIDVGPLSLDAIAALAADTGSAARDMAELHRITNGNAFFVTELLAVDGHVPPSVNDAVLARVAALPAVSRRVVEAVSVAPRSLELARVERLVDNASADDVDRAVSSGVLIADPASQSAAVRFRHDLARSVVEHAMPPARRVSLHRTMCDLLEAEESTDWPRLAHHAIRANDRARIGRFAPTAAELARSTGATQQAVQFARAALDHPDALHTADRAAALTEMATDLCVLGRASEAEQAAMEAVELHRATGNASGLAAALDPLARSLWMQQRFGECRMRSEEAITVLAAHGPAHELASAHHQAAHYEMLRRRRSSAERHLAEARRITGGTGAADLASRIDLMAATVDLVMGDTDAGVDELLLSIDRAQKLKDRTLESTARAMLGSGGGEARRYDVAVEQLEAAIEIDRARDADYYVAYNQAWLARIAFEQGRWDDAVLMADAVIRSGAPATDIAVLTARTALGRVRIRRGDPGGAELLDELVELTERHEVQHGWNVVCGLAEHHWLAGRPEQAEALVTDMFRRALDTDSPWARGEVGFWMWRLGLVESPPSGAAEPFALQIAGDWRAAARVWTAIGCPYEAALARADGDAAASAEALDLLQALGAGAAVALVEKRRREAGMRRSRGRSFSTRSNPAGLTDRQLEVLDLIVHGRSNADIAGALVISPKTVEHHVSAIFSKLAVTDRAAAIATALTRGIIDPPS